MGFCGRPSRPSCAKYGATAGGRKASWARAPNSPSPGEGRNPNSPAIEE
jgi:hypothetical protein